MLQRFVFTFAAVLIAGSSDLRISAQTERAQASARMDCVVPVVAILGTEGDDVIVGTPGPDTIQGLGGNDLIFGLGGDDTICGGLGIDRLTCTRTREPMA